MLIEVTIPPSGKGGSAGFIIWFTNPAATRTGDRRTTRSVASTVLVNVPPSTFAVSTYSPGTSAITRQMISRVAGNQAPVVSTRISFGTSSEAAGTGGASAADPAGSPGGIVDWRRWALTRAGCPGVRPE